MIEWIESINEPPATNQSTTFDMINGNKFIDFKIL